MAARFWGYLLLAELLYAAAVSAVLAATLSLSRVAILATALAACASAPGLLVGASFVLSGVARGACARGGGARLLLAWLRESAQLTPVMLTMIAEPCRRVRDDPAAVPTAPATPVLLIHGILCNRAVWRPLIERLKERGFAPIRAISLEPLLAGLDVHAATVAGELRALRQRSHGAPVAIVAHSMGGLVARAALRLSGPAGIARIVTIAAPHHGTRLARLSRAPPARQMSPDSLWLRALNASQEGRLDVPFTSIYSVHDNLIAPPESSILEGASLKALGGLGHLALLRSRRSLECIVGALTEES